MGIPFSCPFSADSDIENEFESVIVRSISFKDEGKTLVRSISFKGGDSGATIMQSTESGEMIIEGSVSFAGIENNTITLTKAPLLMSECAKTEEFQTNSPRSDDTMENSPKISLLEPNPKHQAAIMLQKVYKSFRTRRKLADGAVLIEQSWWKLLDFAELKRSSISFFDIDKHETAISRWSRARTRAAKVGKGLSKNSKAQKLALQHWLEAIDPRHRYGHNLHFYYVKWLQSQCREPFFYWLDIGEGREVNLVEKCSRSKLQQQCIKYLGPMERKAYEVLVENGMLVQRQTGELLDTTGEPKDAKWIFVLSTSRTLYVGMKMKGTFQHSSFLAGGATLAAGRMVVEKGILKAVWPHSGHYRPTSENFQDFVSFLQENNVDIANIEMYSIEDNEESIVKKSNSFRMTIRSSEEELSVQTHLEKEVLDVEALPLEKTKLEVEEVSSLPFEQPKSRLSSCSYYGELSKLEIPNNNGLLMKLKSENEAIESSFDVYGAAENSFSSDQNNEQDGHHSSEEEHKELAIEETIPEEHIIERINSHQAVKSYQLGRQLSCKWTTGAGPRISCLRDYPSGLQSHALEQVSLSPRSARSLGSNFSPRVSPRVSRSPRSLDKLRRSTKLCRTQSSPLRKSAMDSPINQPS